MNLFTGTIETVDGPVRCVGTHSEETGGGVVLAPHFRIEGFLRFKMVLAQLDGPTLALDIRADSLRTTHRGAGYLIQYVVEKSS